MIKVFLLVLFSLTVFAQDVRTERHHEATEAFKNLNLFYKGRGMAISPDIIKLYEVMSRNGTGTSELGQIYQRWGLLFENNQAKGIFVEPYQGMKVGVLGCVACHSGKAAGEYIVGLGNKNIDVGQIGKDSYNGMLVWGALPHSNPEFKVLHKRSLEFTKGLSDKKFSNLTQGLVPTSLIRSWFYKMQNLPLPENMPRGQVKVPHMWGYGEKRKSGSFWDGEGNGELGGWGTAVELYAGQTAENVREYFDRVLKAEEYLGEFLPPKYPFTINHERAVKGEKIYATSCQGCHGNHQRDLQGHPIYESPKHIPLRIVKTDPERLNALSEELYGLIERNPLNDIIQSVRKPEHGYVAQKLWGVWSRFPFLHNASVPTLYDVVSDPTSRPPKFSLKNSGERESFDETKMGLKIVEKDPSERRLYDTSKPGQSNVGHYFESFKKFTHEDKLDLIEYLKTL